MTEHYSGEWGTAALSVQTEACRALSARAEEAEYVTRQQAKQNQALRAERDAALAVIARVREMHRPSMDSFGPTCEICGEDVGRDVTDQYPCATVQALAAAVPTEPPGAQR